jgi:MT0933-like antitoxin protein
MGLSDRLREAAKKAEEAASGAARKAEGAASEHKDQIRDAVQKAGSAADQRTGGKYSSKIEGASAKADALIEKIADPEQPDAATGGSGAGSEPAGDPPAAS